MMSNNKRRLECPFGCMKGFTQHELTIHLNDKHTRIGLAQKLAEFTRLLRECREDLER